MVYPTDLVEMFPSEKHYGRSASVAAPATTVEFRWSSDVEFGERTAVTGEFTMKALCTSGITSALKCTKSTSAISCE